MSRQRWDDDDDRGIADGRPDSGLGRRDLLRSAGAASVLLGAAQGRAAAAPDAGVGAGKFLTAAEMALLDELSEIIVPTDEHSPGGRAAKVAVEVDRALADGPAYDTGAVADRRTWREGLALVDQLARRSAGVAFLAATPEQRLAVVTAMAAGEARPQKPEERFFRVLKEEVARAYYTSEIGVKQESEYKGNSYLQEFVGVEAGTVPLRLGKPGKR
jgi:hypothetical protein